MNRAENNPVFVVLKVAHILILFLTVTEGRVCSGQTKEGIERTETGNQQNEFSQIDEVSAKRKAIAALRRVLLEKVKAEPPDPSVGRCENIDFQQAGYRVRDIRIEDPFGFLPWVRIRERSASAKIATLIRGQLFRYDLAAAKALDIIETENFLPDTSDVRVKLRVEIVSVENCAGNELDLVYRIYSTQIMPVLSGTPEARVIERQSPQTAAGQTTVIVPVSSPIHFTPTAGYDSTDLFSGGGRLEITQPHLWKLPFKSIILQGEASSRMHTISATLTGSLDSTSDSSRWLAHAEWLLDFTHRSLPTGAGQIKGGHLSAQFSGTTKPLGSGNFAFRFGGLLAGGNRQSDVQAVPLAPDTIASAGFGTLKLYAGLYSRLKHNVLSVSYGLELGSVGPSARVDWRKQIVDLRHEFWYPLGDHRILDLESRFTLGSIQVPGKIPLPERFFGGNNEEFFVPGDTWQIRANPVIRAIPASRLFRTANGAGGTKSLSYNLTAAYAVWRKALVPQELTNDSDFNSELQGAITTVTSTLQNFYSSQDSHYTNVISQLPKVLTDLEDLRAAVMTAQTSHPGQSVELFKTCTRAISGALRRVNSAITPHGSDQYGLVTFLLSDDPDEIQLMKVTQTCGADLNAAIGDGAVAAASAKLDSLRSSLVSEFNKIDQRQAASKANADMSFTRRTLSTLFNEVNVYSVSPVFVFDVAKIGPRKAGLGGLRYGPGVGIRLELATVAHFTTGYAWNVHQGPGEGRGNLFFSIGVRDLFH